MPETLGNEESLVRRYAKLMEQSGIEVITVERIESHMSRRKEIKHEQ
ncbi:MAG: hypothetical protein K2J90_03605 [Lachnospiraceae bacterium]|nr:hypothetical protein [Lachnospiraceae bacterium]